MKPYLNRIKLGSFILLLYCCSGYSQNMQAIHGSPYAGSLSTDFNPANTLNAPYKWDLTIFGLQSKEVTNSVKFKNIGLLSRIPDTLIYQGKSGTFQRYAHATTTVNLLHFRYKLNAVSAITVGVNLRNYIQAQSSPVYWHDTVNTVTKFLRANINTSTNHANFQTSSWMEYSFGYSRVINTNATGQWQAGLQLKLNKSLAGAYAHVSNFEFLLDSTLVPRRFRITDARGEYAYSANMDNLDSNKSNSRNIKDFLRETKFNAGFNIGVEYIRFKDDAYENVNSSYNYNWKLGISLLDIGRNKYQYSINSLRFSGTQQNVTDRALDTFFNNVKSAREFKNQLTSLALNTDSLSGNFYIMNPVRLLLNWDKNLNNNFYVNAEVQVPLTSTKSTQPISTKELSLLTIIPRWEKRSLGAYMPLQYTTEGNFWIGLGIKAGPVIAGLHNLGWLTNKKSTPNGGFYLAFQIRPWKAKEKDAFPCPE